MTRIFIGLGSNIDPEINIPRALAALRRRTQLVNLSTFYLTEPLGRPGQPHFYNGVAEIATNLPPHELKSTLLADIESSLGRRRTADKYAPRTIDLDILLYGDIIINNENLTLPDPHIASRPFLALPLAELAPDLLLPGTNTPLADIAAAHHTAALQPLGEFTKKLKEDLHHGPEKS